MFYIGRVINFQFYVHIGIYLSLFIYLFYCISHSRGFLFFFL